MVQVIKMAQMVKVMATVMVIMVRPRWISKPRSFLSSSRRTIWRRRPKRTLRRLPRVPSRPITNPT